MDSLTHIIICVAPYVYIEWTKKEVKQLKERVNQLEQLNNESNTQRNQSSRCCS